MLVRQALLKVLVVQEGDLAKYLTWLAGRIDTEWFLLLICKDRLNRIWPPGTKLWEIFLWFVGKPSWLGPASAERKWKINNIMKIYYSLKRNINNLQPKASTWSKCFNNFHGSQTVLLHLLLSLQGLPIFKFAGFAHFKILFSYLHKMHCIRAACSLIISLLL